MFQEAVAAVVRKEGGVQADVVEELDSEMSEGEECEEGKEGGGDMAVNLPAESSTLCLVFVSPVTRLEKNRDWTGP